MSRTEDKRLEAESVSKLIAQAELIEEFEKEFPNKATSIIVSMLERRGIKYIHMSDVDDDIDSRPIITGTATVDMIAVNDKKKVEIHYSDDWQTDVILLDEISEYYPVKEILSVVYTIVQDFDDGMYYTNEDGELEKTLDE